MRSEPLAALVLGAEVFRVVAWPAFDVAAVALVAAFRVTRCFVRNRTWIIEASLRVSR